MTIKFQSLKANAPKISAKTTWTRKQGADPKHRKRMSTRPLHVPSRRSIPIPRITVKHLTLTSLFKSLHCLEVAFKPAAPTLWTSDWDYQDPKTLDKALNHNWLIWDSPQRLTKHETYASWTGLRNVQKIVRNFINSLASNCWKQLVFRLHWHGFPERRFETLRGHRPLRSCLGLHIKGTYWIRMSGLR